MTANPVQRGRRYRRAINGVLAVGIVALLVGMVVGQTLAGLVVYAVAVVGGVGATFYLRFGSGVSLGDEREHRLGMRASHVTFELFGYAGLFTFVALFLLDATGYRELGATAETLLYAYAVVTLSWGAIYTVLRYRS